MSGKNPLPHELAYQGVSALNPPDIISSKRDPNVTDTKYPIGTFWINTETRQSFQLLAAPGVWVLLTIAAGGNLSTAGSITAGTTISAGGAINAGTNIIATGTIIAGNQLGVQNGDLQILNGNLVLNGNDSYLQVHGGSATDSIGQGTLVAGTVTIANTGIQGTDRIFVQRVNANASTAIGELSVSIGAGSFTVRALTLSSPGATLVADVSSFVYFIVRQV